MQYSKVEQGFTLLEVMIVAAIVAVLAAIAYASYTNQVMRSNRSDAKVALNDTAQRLQRCYTTYGAYNNANCTVYTTLSAGGQKATSTEGFYEITISNVAATTYTLSATAVATPQTNDSACLVLTLAHTGQRAPEDCW